MIQRSMLLVLLMFLSPLYATQKQASGETNNSLLEAQLQKAIAQEKKFAKEQKFYDAQSYDFKGAEVNQKSLESIEVPQMDDAEMDSSAMLGMDDDENLSW